MTEEEKTPVHDTGATEDYSDAKRLAFYKAFCKAQTECEQPKHDSKVSFKGTHFTYASLKEVQRCLKTFGQNGIGYTQGETFENGKWFLRTAVFHGGGHSEVYKTYLKTSYGQRTTLDSEKEFGSSLTYAKRYALCSIFGLYGEKDIDALPSIIEEKEEKKGFQSKEVKLLISPECVAKIKEAMAKSEEFVAWINRALKHTGASSIEYFPSSFQDAILQKAASL